MLPNRSRELCMRPLRHVNASPAHHPRLAAQHLCCRSGTSKACQHTIPGWLPSTHLPRLHVVPGVGGVEVFVLADAVRQKRGVGWAQLLNAKQRYAPTQAAHMAYGPAATAAAAAALITSTAKQRQQQQQRGEQLPVGTPAASPAQQAGAHLQSHSCRPLNSIFSSRLNVYVRKDSHLIHAGKGKRGRAG